MNLGAIVEGHGEEEAVPLLVKRIAAWLDPSLTVNVPKIRVPKTKLIKEAETKRTIEFMARKAGPAAPILIVLDADDDAPCVLGPQLLGWAREARPDRDVGVVVAVREYEAWFLAAAPSLVRCRGLPSEIEPVTTPEGRHNPKKWLEERLPNGYSETLDQPALTHAMSLELARSADSFDKMIREVARLLRRTAPPRI
jgi:hypothetical protein